MLPMHHDPHFTFRFADDRIIPRFHLESMDAERRVTVFKIDPATGERLGLLMTARVGEGGWVDLPEPITVRAGEPSLPCRKKLPDRIPDVGGGAMIFRLSQKLNGKIKVGTLPTLPLDDNSLADWSAALFVARRTQYILLSNTKSLYSTVLPGKGITSGSAFIERALSGIREFLQQDGQDAVCDSLIAPASATVRYAKALNRSVTGSMNDLTRHAAFWLAEGDVSSSEVGFRLNEIPMSALKHDGLSHGFPRDVFKALVSEL